MAKKVLIIEDDPDINQLIRTYLEKEGYRVSAALTGTEGMRLAKSEHPDMIILDLMLPEMDGFEICKRIRSDAKIAETPIIILTAKTEEADTIVGLELGADEYVTKPFSPKSLVARVKALLRRVDRGTEGVARLVYGPLVVDSARHEVMDDTRPVLLTAKEFGLLAHLIRNQGRVLTRDVLLNTVWGYDYYGTTRTVDVHVRRLKQKMPVLNDAIISIKSLGYKLKEREDSP